MKLTIYQEGSLQIIWDPISGNEYTIHPSSKSIDDAISALFNIKEIDTCMPDLDSV